MKKVKGKNNLNKCMILEMLFWLSIYIHTNTYIHIHKVYSLPYNNQFFILTLNAINVLLVFTNCETLL